MDETKRIQKVLVKLNPRREGEIFSCTSVSELIDLSYEEGDEDLLEQLQDAIVNDMKQSKYIDDIEVSEYNENLPLPKNNLRPLEGSPTRNKIPRKIAYKDVSAALSIFESKFHFVCADISWNTKSNSINIHSKLFENLSERYAEIDSSDELRLLKLLDERLSMMEGSEGIGTFDESMKDAASKVHNILNVVSFISSSKRSHA